MKRSKLLLVLVLALVAVMALVACDKTPVHEHAYGGWTIETAPTASAEGTATRKCACGEKETATLASLSDTSVWTVSNNVPATHTQDGCTVYTSQYGTVVVTLGKLTDHKYGAWEITVEPDLTTAGKAKRTCECGDIDEVDVPALENESVWTKATAVRASHDEEGLVKYTSGYGTVEKTVAKGEHSWSGWKIVTAPTADEKGEAARFCTTDGCKSTETAELPVLTDTTFWTASATAATCTTPEITAYTSLYGIVTVETAPANGHNFQVSAIIAKPKCTEKGSATIKCTVCGCEETKEIAALGHDFEHGTWVINTIITGEEDTKHIRKCSRCDEVSTNLMYRVDHNFGEPVYKVSEPTPGYHSVNAVYTCEGCGYYRTEELTGYLEQESFWTKGEETLADYNNEGRVTYTYKKDNTQITIVTPKKVAPYDGKTYYPLSLNGNSAGRELSCGDSWKNARITLDETGKGTGTAYPFRGDVSVTMVDETTGKVSMKVGNSSYDGYVDFETGLIIRANSTFDSILILIPESMGLTTNDVKASGFADAITMKYASLCNFETPHSFNVFVNGKGVTFNAQYVDKDGNQIEAEQCYLKEYVKILDKEGNRVAAYGKDATSGRLVATDGYEGTYTNSADATENAVIDGLGKVVISGTGYTVNGNYTKAADADYFEVYIVDESGVKVEYYQVTLSGNSYTKVKPMTNVHFVSSEGTAPTITEYNTNIAQTLPAMADVETKVFRGWKIAEDGEAIYTYTPDGTEVTFTAIWANKVSVTLVGVLEGDPTSVVMGEGDNIVSKLPAYKGYETVSADGKKFFVAWKVGENIIEEETIADAELNGQTITAIWQDIPVYAGTYKGANTYGNDFVSSKADVTIDLRGNISGRFSGTITKYDASEQLITFTYNNSTYYFRFDEGSGVLIGGDGTTSCKLTLGGDFDTYGIEKPTKYYRLYAGATSSDALVRFITIKTKYADNDDILFYNDRIYSNISITDALGNVLTTETIKNAKTIVVTDLSTGKIIFKAASTGTKFGDNNYSQALDEYFGTYTCEGQGNLVLDGVGNFAWGSKNGTYTLKDATAKTFDAYVVAEGKNTEYYVITLDTTAKTYVAAEQKVTVTYTSTTITPNEDISAVTVWKNIEFTLKALTNAGNMFRGWYVEGAEGTLYNGAYTATADVTLIAKWDTKFTFTAVYNDGTTANLVKEYGEGDKVTITDPTWFKHKFEGWFTTATFNADTEWTSGTAITANVIVYAKWSDAEAYANAYYVTAVYGSSNIATQCSMQPKANVLVRFDSTGKAAASEYPFNSDLTITDYDKVAGTMNIMMSKTTYKAFIDDESGIIVMAMYAQDTIKEIYILTPFNTLPKEKDYSTSYWDKGATRVIEYTNNGKVYGMILYQNKVTFGVSFKDALENGNTIVGNKCCDAEKIYVFDKNGSVILRFKEDGNTFVAMDGYEGTYTNGDESAIVDGRGNITLNGNQGTYTIRKSGDTTILETLVTENDTKVYYELTLNNMTYTKEKVMVTVTYNTDVVAIEGTPAPASVNKNVAYALPVLTNADKVFRGWYVFTDETKAIVPMNYVPTADVTLVAKWDDKVTLTVVYNNNGLENVVLPYGAGDEIDLSEYVPGYTNGKAFVKWYVLNGGVKEDLPATISTNMTVYCEWVETPPYTITTSGSNQFTYADGVWTSGNKGKSDSTSSFKITALDNITVTFSYKVSSEARYDKLTISKTGESEITESGEVDYTEKTFVLKAGETLEIKYKKDGSGNKGGDSVYIKDLTINGMAITEM